MKLQQAIGRVIARRRLTAALFLGICAGVPTVASADEGGVSFWLPGTFGSLAAAPQQPGWSFAGIYYHTSVSAGGDVARAREVTIGRFNPTVNVNANVNLHADADLGLLQAGYTFATPVLGGQLNVNMTGITGRNSVSVDGTLTAMVGPLVATRQGSIDSSVSGFGDLYPQASLRWNMGVHNFMTYVMGDIPVGAYDSTRLANLGIGHGAIDGGVGYTYFNPQTGHEFSAVTGLTYNFKNTDTDYQNGIDWHLDWGASQFLSKQFFIGAVGYFLRSDHGRQRAGCFPRLKQIPRHRRRSANRFFLSRWRYAGHLNLKGYGEFDAASRPHGWNTWLTFAITPAAERPSPSAFDL